MSCLPTRPAPAPATQRGLTLVELMISMLLGLIVVAGILGMFVANSETHRRTDDLARIQENARVSIQLMGRAMREAGGNPCGLPPDMGLILHSTEVSPNDWWSGGADFKTALKGYKDGTDFTALSTANQAKMVANSDALITVSANTFIRTVTNDTPPGGAMTVSSGAGLANGDILFACSPEKGRGVVFTTSGVTAFGTSWQIARTNNFTGPAASMNVTALGKISAEGWYVGQNTRGGTSLFRAFIGDNDEPEEIAPDVSAMRITYLLPGEDTYKAADQITDAEWPDVIAAYIELTITRNAGNAAITRTVGLTVSLRNRFSQNAAAATPPTPPTAPGSPP